MKPAKDHELFSPSYIYNKKMNKGRDDGLDVTKAIKFVKTHGCATLETMPLDTLTADAEAGSEAHQFRSWSNAIALDVEDIRYYLQRGYPVILVIRNNPEFNSRDPLPEPYHCQNRISGRRHRM